MSSFSERIRVVDSQDEIRNLDLESYRDHIVITPAGPLVVNREDYFFFCRPAQRRDFLRLMGRRLHAWGHDQGALGGFVPNHPIPWSYVTQAISFFRAVWRKHSREDILVLHYFPSEARYEFVHPSIRSADVGGVEYDFPSTPDNALRIGSFHSHGNQLASEYSLIDQKDDTTSPGIHVVLGTLDEGMVPTIHCVSSDGRNCLPVQMVHIFTPWDYGSFPPEWLEK